jgi:hypothetical protein
MVESKDMHVEVSLFLLFAASTRIRYRKYASRQVMFLFIVWLDLFFPPRGKRAEN